MFETSKHVSKTEKRCCVFKDNIWLYDKNLMRNIKKSSPYKTSTKS